MRRRAPRTAAESSRSGVPAAAVPDEAGPRTIDLAGYEQERDARPGEGQVLRRMREHPRVSVVIPTLNEAANLPFVFSRLPSDLFEVLVVDGGSVDDTVAVTRRLRPDARVLRQNRRGKGNALACGFSAAQGDIIVMLDADGSADPGEIPDFVETLRAGAHFAKGTRFACGGGSADITRLRAWGNRGLNGLVNAVYRTSYTDLCYGYNAFWSVCLPYLELQEPVLELAPGDCSSVRPEAEPARRGDGFEIETLVNIRVTAARMVVTEVGSFESRRIFGRSNLNAFRDGFRVLHTIAQERRRLARRPVPNPALPRPWESFSPLSTSVSVPAQSRRAAAVTGTG